MSKKSVNLNNKIILKVILTLAMVVSLLLIPYKTYRLNDLDKRALWVSYIDYQNMSFDSKDSFVKDFKALCEKSVKYHLNTLIVQVRGFHDALYKSKYYPTSFYGIEGNINFDPLKEMVNISHSYDLKIEAWVNPLRISNSTQTYKYYTNTNQTKDWLSDKDNVIEYKEQRYILNPKSQEVIDYITQGIEEIVNNYDVDAICFDDYFYVDGTETNISYQDRLDSINHLVSTTYQTVKAANPKVEFGISPAGNYDNCLNAGADINTWLSQEGYIDYLMPQIYWTDQYGADGSIQMFSDRLKLFASLPRRADVKMYYALALYNCGEKLDYDQGWSRYSDNLAKQIKIIFDHNGYGYSLFRSENLNNKAGQLEMSNILNSFILE